MSALIIDLDIEQGADFQREFTVTKLDGTELENFINADVKGQLRDSRFAVIFDLDLTVTSSKTVLLWIKNEDTELLNVFKHFYYKFDIEAVLPNGLKYRIVEARVTSKQEQTKI